MSQRIARKAGDVLRWCSAALFGSFVFASGVSSENGQRHHQHRALWQPRRRLHYKLAEETIASYGFARCKGTVQTRKPYYNTYRCIEHRNGANGTRCSLLSDDKYVCTVLNYRTVLENPVLGSNIWPTIIL